MEMSRIEARALARADEIPELRRGFGLRPWVIAVAAAFAAIAIQALWIPVDADVSWLITVSERVLSGDRLYVDIFEVNPPASVWLYVPLVWLAQLLGAKPEAVVVAAFTAAGVASTLATVRLASRLDDSPRPSLLAIPVAFVALLLPMALFAQREHAALLLALPALASLAVIAEGKRLNRPVLIACGIAAGLIVAVKPYFVAAVLAPAVWAAWKRRSLGPLLPAVAAGGMVVALYAGAILLFARPYLEWLPVISSTYLPMHDQLWKVLIGPAFYPAICIALAALLRSRRVPPLAWAWALGSAGFLLAAFAQAKNYPNHWLPQTALALAAAAVIAGRPEVTRARRAAVAAALALVGLSAMYKWAILPDPAVEAAIRTVAPPAPRVIGLSPQLTTGHPVTRNVGGQWVGSRAGLFTASGALFVGMKDESIRQAYREDVQSFRTDVERNSPDVILVGIPAKKWLMKEPAVARAMAGYALAARTEETEIWVRRSSPR